MGLKIWFCPFVDLLIGGNKMKLYDFRTEYRNNPIGLTDKAPRFSWKIESEEQNTIQTTYEIHVTDENGNVVWNSGKKSIGSVSSDSL